jgi:hypothetical protein
MSKHRVWLVGLAVAMTLMLTGAASAWEFTMEGSFTWLFETRGQLGPNGFFGPYDVDNGRTVGGTNGTFAPVNGWVGQQLGNLVSGTDGQRQVQWMTSDMDLKINPAVRVRGQYYIGEWAPSGTSTDFGVGELVASQYYNNRFGGIQRSFSPGYWNMLWLTAQLPIAEVAFGKRRSTFGMGMYNNGEESRSSESLAVAVPYGPFRFVISFYPSRRANTTIASATTPYSILNLDNDKNNNRWWDSTIPAITYRSGDLEVGSYVNPIRWHTGGEGIIDTPANRTTKVTYVDYEELYGVTYMKYNNGRFFFNSEVDFDQRITRNRRKATATGGAAAGIRDTYIENWRFVTEMGVLCGPSKLALLYAWTAGPDRRFGQQIDRTGLISSGGFSNTGLFRPYSYLAVYSYGLGTQINPDTNNGYVEDASIWAARLDYAVASNLNVYGSFFWADRVSKSGYGWGFIRPASTDGVVGLTKLANGGVGPSIPDMNLGWEIDSGFDWKLLEGFLVQANFAYWQPGKWFNWACVDKAVPGWGATQPAANSSMDPANWGVNPNRTIDPVWGLELNVKGEF